MAGDAESLKIPQFSCSVTSEWFNVVDLELFEVNPAQRASTALEYPGSDALGLSR